MMALQTLFPSLRDHHGSLSKTRPRMWLTLAVGALKTRSSKTDYQFFAHFDFSYFLGVDDCNATQDSVIVLESWLGSLSPFLNSHALT